MTTKRRTAKPIMAWCGFVEGKPDEWSSVGYAAKPHRNDMVALFHNRADAAALYEDVRRVRIVQVKPKRRLKAKPAVVYATNRLFLWAEEMTAKGQPASVRYWGNKLLREIVPALRAAHQPGKQRG